jgi:hypothetical protein
MDTTLKTCLSFCVLCVLCGDSPPQAQSLPEVLFGVEARRDRFQYHFDNPSSFDTPAPVPHFFEQRYIADNVWAVFTLRYTAGVRWETSIGATPRRTTTADDYDTFFNPDGTVWVSGTTGGAGMQSFRISQKANVGRIGAVAFVAGYRLRMDLADFQLGHKTVRRNGAVVLAADVTSPETTRSRLTEPLLGATASFNLYPAWWLSIDAESAPLAMGRLLVRLPEKYPGQDIVSAARVMTGSARVMLARRGRWPIEAVVDAGRVWSYSSMNRLVYQQLGARVAVGRVW